MDNEFSQRFAMLRQGRGLTQQRLADKLGVTAQAVSKYETGQSLPDVQMLKSIAAVLGCTTDYLLGYELAKEERVDIRERERDGEIGRALQKESLTICVGVGALVDMLREEGKNQYESIHRLRVRLAQKYGILVPVIRMMDQIGLEDKQYEIRLFGDTMAGSGRLEYPMYFYPEETVTKEGDIPATEAVYGVNGVWRRREEEGEADSLAGKKPVSCMEVLTKHLEKVILENYGKIINRQIIAQMVEHVHRRYPAVTEGVVPERVGLYRIQKTVAALVAGGIPVNRLDFIISFLEEHQQDTPEGLEELKAQLKG
ncbi:MAG: FHIPEP family type III secretion protein [Lachnospiraceae bacterium]|nr:FHIPEP family type III secretion protein [Lachnospiraceae bacterium]